MATASEIAAGGVEALDSASQAQIEEAKELVARQVAALEESESAVRKLDAGEPLNKADKRTLGSVVGLSADEIEARHTAEPDPARLEEFFKTPEAYFYVDVDDGSQILVKIKPDDVVELIPDSDENFE
jgi:hypothetical protein